MTKIVTGLEKDGLVERKTDPKDGRLTRIVATPKGQRILIEGRSRRVKSLTAAVDQLNETELAQLNRGIQVFRKLIATTARKTASDAKA